MEGDYDIHSDSLPSLVQLASGGKVLAIGDTKLTRQSYDNADEDGQPPTITNRVPYTKSCQVVYLAQLQRYVTPSGPIFATHVFMGISPRRAAPGTGDGDSGYSHFRNNDLLRESIMNLTSAIGPAVVNSLLRENRMNEVGGSSVETVERLLVSKRTGAAIIALCLLSSCSAFWILARSVLSPPTWWRDPATILGTMAVLRSTDIAEALAHPLRAEHRDRLKQDWEDPSYTHLPLRIWARSVFVVYVIGLIIGLLVSLDISETNDGLETIDRSSQGSSSILWKSIPALAMVCVAVYTASSETAMRSLAIFSKLLLPPPHCSPLSFSPTYKKKAAAAGCQMSILDISLLDMISLRALYYSFSLWLPAVGIMQLLAIFCGFLTILSSVLYNVEIIPASTEMTIQPQSWFSNPNSSDGGQFSPERALVALLLMRGESNLTYPRHTWGKFAFPTIHVDTADVEAAGGKAGDGSVINIAVPALMLIPRCKRAEDVVVTISEEETSSGNSSSLVPKVTITNHFTCPNGTILQLENGAIPELVSSISQWDPSESDENGWFLVSNFAQAVLNTSQTDDGDCLALQLYVGRGYG